MPTPPSLTARRRLRRAWTALAVLALSAGCQSASGPMARWRLTHDHVIAKPPTAEEVGDDRGFLARMLTPEKAKIKPKTDRDVVTASTDGQTPIVPDREVEAEFRTAEQLFQQGKLAEAEKIFARIDKAKNQGHSTTGYQFQPGKGLFWKGDDKEGSLFTPLNRSAAPWGQKALYFLAESQYQQGKLVAANDSFAKLVNTYPGTRYLEKAVAREYQIALTWLEAVDPNAKPEKREKWGDRFNGKLPLVDVTGHAIQVLEHVRHHDPTGPLADDAVMRIADYYYQTGNYEEASMYYDQLINEDAKSPLLHKAQLASIDSKLKSYYGPDYDSDGLDKAQELIKQTMTNYPERDAKVSESLAHNLDLIRDQQAEISYRHGEFYRDTGYPGAAEFYFGEVRARWPSSPWAQKAKDQLELIAKMPRKKVLPSQIMTTPGSPDPYSSGASMGQLSTSPGGFAGGGPGGGYP